MTECSNLTWLLVHHRYCAGSAKLRASSASPGVAGAVAAAAAAAAATGMPSTASWQALQRYGQQQRDQGPARAGAQGRRPQQQQQQQLAAGMMQCDYDLLGQQVRKDDGRY
jgi:hypothetical protein